MQLIKTKETDINELTRISIEAFDSDVAVGAASAGGPPKYDSTQFHQEMMRNNNIYTAIVDEEIVGGAIVFVDPKNSAVLYIGRIFIDPTHFRKGYGIKIMELLESIDSNIRVLKLDTPIWNVRTNRFYQKLGYHESYRDQEFVYYEKIVN